MQKTTAGSSHFPAFILHFVPERKGAPWIPIGAMWPTNSGEGFRVLLNLIPHTPGNIVALPPRQQEQEEEGA